MNYNEQRLIIAELTRLIGFLDEDWRIKDILLNPPKNTSDVSNLRWVINTLSDSFRGLDAVQGLCFKIEDEELESAKSHLSRIKSLKESLIQYGGKDLSETHKEEVQNIWTSLSLEYLYSIDILHKFLDKKKMDLKKQSKLILRELPKGNYLYHAVKPEYVQEILERGSILGYTSHRYWANGIRRKDDQSDYNDSFWMKGVSLTRNIEYALQWGLVVLIFNKDNLTKKHKIENYNWGFHIKGSQGTKKETEEFLVLSKKDKTFKNKDNPEWKKEYEEAVAALTSDDPEDYASYVALLESKKELININEISQPEGEFNFTKLNALEGFFVRAALVEIHGLEDPLVQYLINHEKFICILDR